MPDKLPVLAFQGIAGDQSLWELYLSDFIRHHLHVDDVPGKHSSSAPSDAGQEFERALVSVFLDGLNNVSIGQRCCDVIHS